VDRVRTCGALRLKRVKRLRCATGRAMWCGQRRRDLESLRVNTGSTSGREVVRNHPSRLGSTTRAHQDPRDRSISQRSTSNPRVGGSNPPRRTRKYLQRQDSYAPDSLEAAVSQHPVVDPGQWTREGPNKCERIRAIAEHAQSAGREVRMTLGQLGRETSRPRQPVKSQDVA